MSDHIHEAMKRAAERAREGAKSNPRKEQERPAQQERTDAAARDKAARYYELMYPLHIFCAELRDYQRNHIELNHKSVPRFLDERRSDFKNGLIVFQIWPGCVEKLTINADIVPNWNKPYLIDRGRYWPSTDKDGRYVGETFHSSQRPSDPKLYYEDAQGVIEYLSDEFVKAWGRYKTLHADREARNKRRIIGFGAAGLAAAFLLSRCDDAHSENYPPQSLPETPAYEISIPNG